MVAAPEATVARLDSYQNLVTGEGVAGRDKRATYSFSRRSWSPEDWRDRWRESALAARIVERPAEDAFREGWRCQTGHRALDDAIRGRAEDLGLDEAMKEAYQYSRALGGGAVVFGIDDLQPLDRPLRVDLARSFDWCLAFDATELWADPTAWDFSPFSPTYGLPLIYNARLLQGGQLRIHRSRMAIFTGPVCGRRHQRERQGWGDSYLQRVDEVLASYELNWRAADVVFSEFSTVVYRFKGWRALLASAKGVEDAREIIRLIDYAKGVVKGVVVDSEDSLERLTAGLTGVADILREAKARVTSVADMPATLLHGGSPDGLNATGASDIRGWYDRVGAFQRTKVRPQLETPVRVLARLEYPAYQGDYRIEFNPLWQPTEKEQADTRKVVAETDAIYEGMGAVVGSEVRRSRFGGEGYSPETELDPKVTESLDRQARARRVAPPAPPAPPPPPAPPIQPAAGAPNAP